MKPTAGARSTAAATALAKAKSSRTADGEAEQLSKAALAGMTVLSIALFALGIIVAVLFEGLMKHLIAWLKHAGSILRRIAKLVFTA